MWTRAVVLLNVAEVRDDPAEFYSTTGNHNDWDSERMQEGSVLSLVFWLQFLHLRNLKSSIHRDHFSPP